MALSPSNIYVPSVPQRTSPILGRRFQSILYESAFGKSWLGDLLGNTGMLSHTMPQTTVNSAAARCPKCNWSFEDINKTGLLGCPHCYEHFESSLKGLFQRIQRALSVGRKRQKGI